MVVKCQKLSTSLKLVAESQSHFRLWKVFECWKAKLSNKPEICKADFSVHAQKPHK